MNPTTSANVYSDNKNQEDEKILLQPFNHFKQPFPANHILEKIWTACNYWFQVPEDKFKEISTIGNKLGAAGLIMDDLVDNSVLRGGIPTSRLVYGRSRTIHSSIYAFISAMEKFDDFKMVDIFIATGVKLCQGQAMETYFARNGICPTEEEYQQTVFNKTTSAISFIVSVQQLFATQYKNSNFDPFLVPMGLFFQICNDYVNLASQSYAKLKVFGDDITEGIFTFPIIHGIKTHPEDHRLLDILKQRTSDKNVKLYFIKLLEEFGSLDYTLESLEKLKNEYMEEITKIAANPEMEKILDDALNDIEAVVM
ncbi:terpene synthase-like [Zophobas morio]|uniref:terpene synthase-like n=1 Tax=Zophobas morio TaxID=2755281 RepID=UPI003082E9E7